MNIENKPKEEQSKIFNDDVVDNLAKLDSIIQEIKKNTNKFDKRFIDEKTNELDDIHNRFLDVKANLKDQN